MRGLAGIQTPSTQRQRQEEPSQEEAGLVRGYTYLDMVKLCRRHDRMQRVLRDSSSASSTNTEDAKLNPGGGITGKSHSTTTRKPRIWFWTASPSPCRRSSRQSWYTWTANRKTSCLHRAKTNDNRSSYPSCLDWEELFCRSTVRGIVCRKVCANRSQADKVWKAYREELPQPNLGPIEPWLKLETVHSLTTLLYCSNGSPRW
jgi:hypothetical protein